MISRWLKILLSLMALAAPPAAAQSMSFMTPGTESKMAAGATTTLSRSAPAVMSNPANLSLVRKFESYVELSVMSFDYSYEYPGQDPVSMSIAAPMPFVGFALRPASVLSLGLVFLPTPGGAMKYEIEDLPMRIGSPDPAMVTIATEGSGFGYTAGVGASLNIRMVSLGVSVLSSRSPTMGVTLIDSESGQNVVALETTTATDKVIVGARVSPGPVKLGVAWKPPVTTTGSGRSLNENGEEFESKSKGYSAISAGAEVRLGRIIPFADVTYKDYSQYQASGAMSAMSSRLNGGKPPEADYFNVTDMVFGMKFVRKKHRLLGAYGWYPSYIGNGALKQYAEAEVEIKGPSFGDFDAIPRQVFSGGYTFRRNKNQIYNIGGAYHTGFRAVPEASAGYGNYNLDLIMVTSGAVFRF